MKDVRLNNTRKRFGFTFLEILVALLILGVVSALLFPNLNTALERERLRQAEAVLQQIWAAEKIYYFKYGHYMMPSDTLGVSDQGEVYNILKVENANNSTAFKHFNFTVISETDQQSPPYSEGDYTENFVFNAWRKSGTHKYNYIIKKDGTVTSTDSSPFIK
ncbi:MAG: prepilin-type N-terminal cleavage/methylation domain-containing protein [Candidatus Omnitrophota bacterium]